MKNENGSFVGRQFVKVVLLVLAVNFMSLAIFYFIYKPKIAYVNSSVLLEKYQGMIEARNRYQETTKKWQNNIDTLQSELKNAMLDYEKNRSKLTKRENELTMENLEHKRKDLMQYQQAVGQKASQEENKLLQAPIGQVNDFVSDYGKKYGYKMIFGTTGGNILYGDEAVDITNIILEGLNNNYNGKKR